MGHDRAGRLLVFDLDGTLVDSLPDITAAVNRMFAARGLPPLSRAQVGPMVGDGLAPLIARAFAAQDSTPDAAAAEDYLADYEANVLVDTTLFAGIREAMTAMAADGWRFAVCTNKPERAAQLLLEGLGIAGLFAAVGGGDSFAARKPDPLHLQATITAAGGDPAHSVMVGDHHNDVAAARGAGVRAVFAGWGYGRPGMEEGANVVCGQPVDLPRVVAEMMEESASF
jgi:phosphoglycolate phosphatase